MPHPPDPEQTNGRTRISPTTAVSIALLLPLIATVAFLADERASFRERLNGLERRIDDQSDIMKAIANLSQRVIRIEDRYNLAASDRWTGSDMVRWAERLREANAGLDMLVVPRPIPSRLDLKRMEDQR